ncbi:MAG: hypothetical protein ACODAJ_08290 [Planctomycetota bacterium]
MSRLARLKAPLPLLGKELVEQAARRRTYVLRTVCAVLLFVVFGVVAHDLFERARYGLAQLGRGREMFEALIYLQFVGVLLFQPALMSGVLAGEKERQSLSLLLLTDLRPSEILFQKYVSRLIPMFTILLLALPLLGLSYAFGGLTTTYLKTGVYVLVITSLQVGALALLCSSFCRTSLGAFLSSYLLATGWYLGVPFAMAVMGISPFGPLPSAWGSMFMPLYLFVRSSMGARFMGMAAPTVTFGSIVGQSLGVLASILVFLAMARAFLLRRAFLAPKNELLLLLRAIDRFFNALNAGFGNIVLVRDRHDLPGDEPIAWRETARKSLGTVRYLFRILVVLEVPVLFVGLFALVLGPNGRPTFLSSWLFVVWVLSALSVTVMSANAIVSERVHQTLDVLLTVPIRGRDILKQKLRGVRRLIGVLLVPFLSIFVLEAWWREGVQGAYYGYGRDSWEEWGWAGYLVSSVLLVAVYLPMLSWFALWVSLKCRTRFRAILTALLTLTGWVGLPWLVAVLFAMVTNDDFLEEGAGVILMLASPGTMVVLTEFAPRVEVPVPVLIALNTLAYAGVLVLFRTMCLNAADRLLGRVEEPPPVPYVTMPAGPQEGPP